MIRLRQSEKVILAGLLTPQSSTGQARASLEELERLVESAGGTAAAKIIQRKTTPDPALLIGQGKAEEIGSMARRCAIHTVIFDEELTPTQQRNLEEAIGAKIIDRTRLILDVFAQRARTKEGILQVELAQNSYLLSRLTGKGAQFSQQWGGIGTRGPGERALEYDRRKIRTKIQHIKKELAGVKKERAVQRARRLEEGIAQAAVVGYTNVGKSSLLNKLIRPNGDFSSRQPPENAPAYADDRLFATLDPLTKRIYLPCGLPILLTDTVGFINKLPTHLVASFQATLEEIQWTDILLIIDDPIQTLSEIERHQNAVAAVLESLRVNHYPAIRIFSKADLIAENKRELLRRQYPQYHFTSSITGEGIRGLLDIIEERLIGSWPKNEIRLRAKDGHLVSKIYRLGKVLNFDQDKNGDYRILWQAPKSQLAKIKGIINR